MQFYSLKGRKKELTEEGINEFLKLYDEGLNYVEIGKKLGAGEEVITRWAKELQVKDRRRKYELNENYFSNIDSDEKAYWLGFLSADGYIDEQRNRIRLELQESDKDSVALFANTISKTYYEPKSVVNNGFLHYYAVLISKKLVQDLKKYNIYQNKSLTFAPPELPNNLIPYWIIGYMDGDGCLYKSKERLKISFTGTYETCSFIKSYFNSNNAIRQEHRCVNNTYSFTLEVALTEKFLKDIHYDTLPYVLKRKQQIYASFIQ